MKVQACVFNRSKGGKNERGLAFQEYFDSNEVKFIVDESGKKVCKVWDYNLINPNFHEPHMGIDLDAIHLPNKISSLKDWTEFPKLDANSRRDYNIKNK